MSFKLWYTGEYKNQDAREKYLEWPLEYNNTGTRYYPLYQMREFLNGESDIHLGRAFHWASTPQGRIFWEELSNGCTTAEALREVNEAAYLWVELMAEELGV